MAELKLSASSVAHSIPCSQASDNAVADRRLAANAARGVKLPRKTPKARNYLTDTQASALADESKHPDIVLLLATTGLRWGAMAALRARHIDLGPRGDHQRGRSVP